MPHDKNGELLEIDDEVIVRCKVRNLYDFEGNCNLTVETVEPFFPNEYKSVFTINTKQVIKTAQKE